MNGYAQKLNRKVKVELLLGLYTGGQGGGLHRHERANLSETLIARVRSAASTCDSSTGSDRQSEGT